MNKPTQTNTLFETEIGVDVAKHKLDIFDGKKCTSIPNNKTAITSWLKSIKKKHSSVRVSCESTGTYGNLLIKRCLQLKVAISMLTPSMVKSFIRSAGRFAKTDRIDAQAIAKFSGYHQPSCLGQPWLELDRLKQIHRRIDALKRSRAKNKASLDQFDSADIKADIKSEINAQNRRIEKLEKKLNEQISLLPELTKRKQILEDVKGVGQATSNALLVHMPELGSLNRRQVSALVGLAPQHNESGTFTGRRMIRGGRSSVRSALYMAALVASRSNEMFKGFYQRLKKKGKPAKVALIAVARKLLIHLNSLLKQETIKI